MNSDFHLSKAGPYRYIVSFGCMCSCATFLRKEGFRSFSSIFDWADSTFFGNIQLVEDQFADLLNPSFFIQSYCPERPEIITNTKYSYSFVHLFEPKGSLSSQLKKAKKKAGKKILSFQKALSSKSCLLVYYCRKEEELRDIAEKQEQIEGFLSRHSLSLLFVLNQEPPSGFRFRYFVLPANNIHKPFGGPVSFPFSETKPLVDCLASVYSPETRKNESRLRRKTRKSAFFFIRSSD